MKAKHPSRRPPSDKRRQWNLSQALSRQRRRAKRKSKAPVVSEPKIFDIDEIKSPITGSGRKRKAGADDGIRPATPPPSRPALVENDVGSVEDKRVDPTCKPTAATPPPSGDASIGEKIQQAIQQSEHVAGGGRNHQKSPTWHQKILMYDPIVLEDLTVWLNTEGLNLVNEDREVSPLEVRDWCESKGVCCLWKGGWRGQKVNGLEE